jgi:hypothetical protein
MSCRSGPFSRRREAKLCRSMFGWACWPRMGSTTRLRMCQIPRPGSRVLVPSWFHAGRRKTTRAEAAHGVASGFRSLRHVASLSEGAWACLRISCSAIELLRVLLYLLGLALERCAACGPAGGPEPRRWARWAPGTLWRPLVQPASGPHGPAPSFELAYTARSPACAAAEKGNTVSLT